MNKELERAAIERDMSHPYDRGYWRRYDGGSRPTKKGPLRDGWDVCNRELLDEAAILNEQPKG